MRGKNFQIGKMWGNQGLNILGTTKAELYREVNSNGGISTPYRFQMIIDN
ncbi:MAG: hypothetical protein LBG92_02050 [Prevotellaceae bacterium]|nr:hypothetical protein [Prevotellaceae bacterium]